MFATKFSCCCVLLVLVSPTTAPHQPSGGDYELPRVEYRPVSPWPPSMGESYDHDSTASGNYLRNLAGVIHARATLG